METAATGHCSVTGGYMNRPWLICLATYLLTLALLLTISPASTDFGVLRLFGSPRVLMVYVCASLPMSWVLARRFPVLHLTFVVLSIAGIGCLIALAISANFSSLGMYSAGYAQRALTRGIVGLALVLPLCSMFSFGVHLHKREEADRGTSPTFCWQLRVQRYCLPYM